MQGSSVAGTGSMRARITTSTTVSATTTHVEREEGERGGKGRREREEGERGGRERRER